MKMNGSTKTTLKAKSLVVGAALTLVLSGGLVACGNSNTDTQASEPAATQTTTTEQPAQSTTAEQPTQTGVTTNWVTDSTAEAAAKGANLTKFGLPSQLTIADQTYQNPTYAHADGVAQGTYETGAIAVIVRKGNVNAHSAKLTDRTETEFASKWTKDVDNLKVTLLGAEQGKATVATWIDGKADYGVTYQGLGGEEVTMTEDEVATIVRAIRDANADANAQTTQDGTKKDSTQQNQNQQNQNSQQGQSQQQNTNGATSDMISSDKASSIATSYVAGDSNVSNVSAQLVTGGDAPHYVVTFHFDDANYTVEVDAYTGSVWDSYATFNDGSTQTFQPQGNGASESTSGQTASGQTSTTDTAGMISSGEASNIATSYVAGGNSVSNVSSQLVTGCDAPHYVVTFHYDDANYTVEVDAYTGSVWDSYATFNDGSTQTYTDDDDNDSPDYDDYDNDNDAYDQYEDVD